MTSGILVIAAAWHAMQIGRDPRISGPILAASLAAGLTSKGVHVARFGYATTPCMFMSTITEGNGADPLSCKCSALLRHVGRLSNL